MGWKKFYSKTYMQALSLDEVEKMAYYEDSILFGEKGIQNSGVVPRRWKGFNSDS
jgi:hypothetical protein